MGSQEDSVWCGTCMLHSANLERELEDILIGTGHYPVKHLGTDLARARHNLEALGEIGCLDKDTISRLSEVLTDLEETIHRWRWQDDNLSWEHRKETEGFIENKVRPKVYVLKFLWQDELVRLAGA